MRAPAKLVQRALNPQRNAFDFAMHAKGGEEEGRGGEERRREEERRRASVTVLTPLLVGSWIQYPPLIIPSSLPLIIIIIHHHRSPTSLCPSSPPSSAPSTHPSLFSARSWERFRLQLASVMFKRGDLSCVTVWAQLCNANVTT
eukprot:5849-Rhodomonas_salina.1